MIPIVPELQLRYELWGQHEALYHQWKIAKERAEPIFVIENVRYVHDPNWRSKDNFMSIQNAHEMKHWVWKATAVAFVVGSAAGAGVMF